MSDQTGLTIWGRRSAFNVQKVLWLVGELGIPHTHIDAGGDAGGLDTPEFRAMNPHGRVPVIRDAARDGGGTVVWESHTILRYLAAVYGKQSFWHDDPAARSRDECWMDWSATALQPAFLTGLFWGYYRTPEDRRDWTAIRVKQDACAQYMRVLDAELADRPYLSGDRLGLADIPAGTCLFRYFGMGLEYPEVPNVQAWFARLQERPAYREHVMLPFDNLYGRLAF